MSSENQINFMQAQDNTSNQAINPIEVTMYNNSFNKAKPITLLLNQSTMETEIDLDNVDLDNIDLVQPEQKIRLIYSFNDTPDNIKMMTKQEVADFYYDLIINGTAYMYNEYFYDTDNIAKKFHIDYDVSLPSNATLQDFKNEKKKHIAILPKLIKVIKQNIPQDRTTGDVKSYIKYGSRQKEDKKTKKVGEYKISFHIIFDNFYFSKVYNMKGFLYSIEDKLKEIGVYLSDNKDNKGPIDIAIYREKKSKLRAVFSYKPNEPSKNHFIISPRHVEKTKNNKEHILNFFAQSFNNDSNTISKMVANDEHYGNIIAERNNKATQLAVSVVDEQRIRLVKTLNSTPKNIKMMTRQQVIDFYYDLIKNKGAYPHHEYFHDDDNIAKRFHIDYDLSLPQETTKQDFEEEKKKHTKIIKEVIDIIKQNIPQERITGEVKTYIKIGSRQKINKDTQKAGEYKISFHVIFDNFYFSKVYNMKGFLYSIEDKLKAIDVYLSDDRDNKGPIDMAIYGKNKRKLRCILAHKDDEPKENCLRMSDKEYDKCTQDKEHILNYFVQSFNTDPNTTSKMVENDAYYDKIITEKKKTRNFEEKKHNYIMNIVMPQKEDLHLPDLDDIYYNLVEQYPKGLDFQQRRFIGYFIVMYYGRSPETYESFTKICNYGEETHAKSIDTIFNDDKGLSQLNLNILKNMIKFDIFKGGPLIKKLSYLISKYIKDTEEPYLSIKINKVVDILGVFIKENKNYYYAVQNLIIDKFGEIAEDINKLLQLFNNPQRAYKSSDVFELLDNRLTFNDVGKDYFGKFLLEKPIKSNEKAIDKEISMQEHKGDADKVEYFGDIYNALTHADYMKMVYDIKKYFVIAAMRGLKMYEKQYNASDEPILTEIDMKKLNEYSIFKVRYLHYEITREEKTESKGKGKNKKNTVEYYTQLNISVITTDISTMIKDHIYLYQYSRFVFVPYNIDIRPLYNLTSFTDEKVYNRFTGYVCKYIKKYTKEDIKPILDHITHLCCQNESYANEFLYYLSYILRYPYKKSRKCYIFYSQEHQTGKGLFFNAFKKYIYGQNCVKINDLAGTINFNTRMEDKTLIILEEAKDVETTDKNTLSVIKNKMKDWITEHYTEINGKHINQADNINYWNFIILSNNHNCVPYERDQDRYNYMETGVKKSKAHYDKLAKILDDQNIWDKFYSYLMDNYVMAETDLPKHIMTTLEETIKNTDITDLERYINIRKNYVRKEMTIDDNDDNINVDFDAEDENNYYLLKWRTDDNDKDWNITQKAEGNKKIIYITFENFKAGFMNYFIIKEDNVKKMGLKEFKNELVKLGAGITKKKIYNKHQQFISFPYAKWLRF